MQASGLIPKEQDLSLLVDLYELAIAQAYWAEGMQETGVFSLFFRKLPPESKLRSGLWPTALCPGA